MYPYTHSINMIQWTWFLREGAKIFVCKETLIFIMIMQVYALPFVYNNQGDAVK